jgi:hypothetical protein
MLSWERAFLLGEGSVHSKRLYTTVLDVRMIDVLSVLLTRGLVGVIVFCPCYYTPPPRLGREVVGGTGAQEENAFEGLCEKVGALGSRWDLLENEDVGLDLLLDLMMSHDDRLCMLGGAVGVGHVDGALVVNRRVVHSRKHQKLNFWRKAAIHFDQFPVFPGVLILSVENKLHDIRSLKLTKKA